MPKFAANLSMLYNEHSFLDRFAAAAADGFEGVEYLFPYAFDAQQLAQKLRDHGLKQVLFNAPPGNWDAGERGLACLPGRSDEFLEGMHTALRYAKALNCSRVHVMAGIVPKNCTRADVQAQYLNNLCAAANLAADAGVKLLIEPINTRDMPGYFLNRQDHAHALVQELCLSNVQVQFDLYHCQIVEGDVASKLRQYLPTGRVGHIQIAGVPERAEPSVGELNYPYLLALIDALAAEHAWPGWVGCEYRPALGAVANGTSDGLGWLKAFKGQI